jgi:regulator of sirC expression with transglutaminase-like and TPR domain
LALYNQAIGVNPNGPLDIEARLGIARSWQQLGEREREIKALKALLQKHSSGPIVQRARERLDAISREN